MRAKLLIIAVSAVAAAVSACPARAEIAGAAQAATPEQELAEKYAPVVRLVEQEEECGDGEPFEPTDVDVLLGNEEVALRGPWDRTNVVKVAPSAQDLSTGKVGYHLDFPGDALEPGCDYELFARRAVAGREPAVYARVVGEPARPGELALQYWFFYPYNDFNNKHEGDWEMIQLVFQADDAAEALTKTPAAVGYSQHEGAERADWDDEKLELVDGTHPVVYPAAGSHANYYEPALYLGRSAAQGVGCDDTNGPSRAVTPRVAFVPTEPEQYLPAYPWLGFQGRWGEKRPAFYDGPTGPNAKLQWSRPLTWAEETWRDRSFAVPLGSSLAPSATGVFCSGVEAGSNLLTALVRNPLAVFIALGALLAVLLWAASRTDWEPSAPLRVERRRAWGQIVVASRRMYREHFRRFVLIGLVFLPLSLPAALLQVLFFRVTGLNGLPEAAGESNASVGGLLLGFGLFFELIALVLVQAASAQAIVEIDSGRPVSVLDVYRRVFERLWSLLGALFLIVVAVAVLSVSTVGVPVAVWLLGRWSVAAQAVQLEHRSAWGALRRSSELVRGRWFRSATLTLTFGLIGLLTGATVGCLLLFVTDASLDFVNVVAALVYTITIPFIAIGTTYVFFDLRVRQRLEPAEAEPDVLSPETA